MMSSYKEHLDLNGFDDDEDFTDDEVFTRGGKSIPIEENGVNKPLMAPRQRTRGDTLQTKVRKVPPLQVIWAPVAYGLIALGAVIGIICLVVFLINIFMTNINSDGRLIHSSKEKLLVPCHNLTVEDVWSQPFPMLTTETAIRLNDINQDGIEDLVLGFGTGADAFHYPPVVCDVYFHGVKSCGGGLMALDGRTGKELWRHYSPHEIFAVNCNVDLDGDGIKDCIGGGRMAGMRAVRGKNGSTLWIFDDVDARVETSNFYTPQFVKDLDFDHVPDIVVIHGGDPMKEPGSETRLAGRILVMSGKTGKVLQWVEVPDKRESYYSPQILTHPDGTEVVLFGTGGETHGGSLWIIDLGNLLKGQIEKAKAIYTDTQKGIMTPPVLVDVNEDEVPDIVMAMFNSTVIAYNGFTLEKLWHFHLPSSESYSTPGVGFYNNDSIPDFIINYQIGPGFPIYYYTQTTILDGKNGKPLLDKPIRMSVGTQTSPLAISVDGFGNDIFLYWVSDCHGSRKQNLEFDFIKGTSIHEQTRSDFCKLRFKEKLYTKLHAMSSNSGTPGIVVYDSDAKKQVEYGHKINYTAIGHKFLKEHPQYWPDYYQFLHKDGTLWPEDSITEDGYPPGIYNDGRIPNYLHNMDVTQGNQQNQYSNGQNSMYIGNENKQFNQQDDVPGMRYPNSYSNLRRFGSYRNGQSYDTDDTDDYSDSPNYYRQKGWHGSVQDWKDAYDAEHWINPSDRKMYLQHRRRYDLDNDMMQKKENYLPLPRPEWRSSKRRVVSNNGKRRIRPVRHVGPHDDGGIQRTISTGTLAPTLGPDNGNSIDIIFSTFWFYPAHTQALLPEDISCIEARMAQEAERFQPGSHYFKMDHDAYEVAVSTECLKKNGHFNDQKSGTYVNVGDYNPFDRQMGQMTVYRMRLFCNCLKELSIGEQCTRILPFEQQGWTSYMGCHGNNLYNPRPSS